VTGRRHDRRTFLRRSAAAAAGAALGPAWLRAAAPAAAAAKPAPPARGMRYRTLGARTGLKVSEIGFGGYPVQDPDVLRRAIDLGITYVDTSDDYRDGDSERTIGEVMRDRRREVVLATKWHPWSHTTKAEMLASLEGSLKRLRTDHVDLIQVHQVGQPSGAGDGRGGGDPIDRLTNPELFEAFETAKRQGKARFLGATGHDGDLMRVMDHVVASGRFDVILCRYNFVDYPEQQLLFRRAVQAGIGVAVMKTLAGARRADLSAWKGGGATFAQSALRWVLSNPDVSTAVISIATVRQAEEYAAAPGDLTQSDRDRLDAWAAAHGRDWCRMCNACEPACPSELKIADLLRARMYLERDGDRARARTLWRAAAAAGGGPSACLDCAAPCRFVCAWGVDVKTRLAEGARWLG
jgi:aryl-alcohol dehydrogenase-like predicted oxidoreductase